MSSVAGAPPATSEPPPQPPPQALRQAPPQAPRQAPPQAPPQARRAAGSGPQPTAQNPAPFLRACRAVYLQNGEDKRYLQVMAWGSTNESVRDAFNHKKFTEASPSSKRLWVPRKLEWINEVNRRTHFLRTDNPDPERQREIFSSTRSKPPRPGGWKIGECQDWLATAGHFIGDDDDNTFLLQQINRLGDLMDQARNEERLDKNTIDHWSKRGFGGSLSACRLIHCFCHDSVRQAVLTRKQAKTRQELDSRGTSSERPSVWVAIAKLFNDSSFTPSSVTLDTAEYGSYFEESRDLIPCPSLGNITEEKAEGYFNLWMKKLKIMKVNHGKSGNGSGMVQPRQARRSSSMSGDFSSSSSSEDEDGQDAADVTIQKEARRKDFLHSCPPVCLYMWYLLEECQLMDTCLTVLPRNAAATSGRVIVVGEDDDSSISTTTSNSAGTSATAAERRTAAVRQELADQHEQSLRALGKMTKNQLEHGNIGNKAARLQQEIGSIRHEIIAKQSNLHELEKTHNDREFQFVTMNITDEASKARIEAILKREADSIQRQKDSIASLRQQIDDLKRQIQTLEQQGQSISQAIDVDATPKSSNNSARRRGRRRRREPREEEEADAPSSRLRRDDEPTPRRLNLGDDDDDDDDDYDNDDDNDNEEDM